MQIHLTEVNHDVDPQIVNITRKTFILIYHKAGFVIKKTGKNQWRDTDV